MDHAILADDYLANITEDASSQQRDSVEIKEKDSSQ